MSICRIVNIDIYTLWESVISHIYFCSAQQMIYDTRDVLAVKTHETLKRAIKNCGVLSLTTIVSSQYHKQYPANTQLPFEPKEGPYKEMLFIKNYWIESGRRKKY